MSHLRIQPPLVAYLLVAAALVLPVGCGGGDDEAPEAAAEAFFTAAAEGDADAACEHATESPGGEDLSCDSFVEVIEFTPLSDPPESYETVEESGDTASITVTAADGSGFDVELINEDGWKVDDIDLPEQ